MNLPKVIGHRGAARLAPENTLASIRAAAEVGVKWVEIDVYPLADNGLVIFHDDTLERCSNGTGVTAEQSTDYVLSLHADKGFDGRFAGEPIPTLRDALACIQSLGLGLNLEIKYDGKDVERIIPPIKATLDRYWQDNEKLLISSFNHAALVKYRALDTVRYMGWLCEAIPPDWHEKLTAIQAYSLNCDYTKLKETEARAIKAAGYKLLCYTANNANAVKIHWEWGMDAVITDDPRVFLSIV